MRVDAIRVGDELRPDLPENVPFRVVGSYSSDGLIDAGPMVEQEYEEVVGYDEDDEPITETRTRLVPPQWPPLVTELDDKGNEIQVPGPYPEVVAFEVELIVPAAERVAAVEQRLDAVSALAEKANATAQEVAQAARPVPPTPGSPGSNPKGAGGT